MKFELIKNKSLGNKICNHLKELGYTYYKNKYNGGDNDYLLVDEEFKKFTWLENGYEPSEKELHKLWMKQKTLEDVIKYKVDNF